MFWELLGGEAPQLSTVMLRLYSIPVHSAAVERLWSLLGHIHTATRNSLELQRVVSLQKVIPIWWSGAERITLKNMIILDTCLLCTGMLTPL